MTKLAHSILIVVLGTGLLSGCGGSGDPPPAQIRYDPYPTGIIPPDIDSEIARVLRENQVIRR